MGPNNYRPYTPKLPELVKSRFNNAKANGDINFYPTQVAVLKPESIPVRLTSIPPSLSFRPHQFSKGVQTTNNNG